jgi:hypothetical protein
LSDDRRGLAGCLCLGRHLVALGEEVAAFENDARILRDEIAVTGRTGRGAEISRSARIKSVDRRLNLDAGRALGDERDRQETLGLEERGGRHRRRAGQ